VAAQKSAIVNFIAWDLKVWMVVALVATGSWGRRSKTPLVPIECIRIPKLISFNTQPFSTAAYFYQAKIKIDIYSYEIRHWQSLLDIRCENYTYK
jgi:hypothetical protein